MDLRGFQETLCPVAEEGRHSGQKGGDFDEVDIAVNGRLADARVPCDFRLVQKVAAAKGQSSHHPPKVRQRVDRGDLPQISLKISGDVSLPPPENTRGPGQRIGGGKKSPNHER